MPNRGFRLILPNTSVAEIVTWQQPQPQHTTNSDWLLGFFEWREQRLPLLSIHIADQIPAEGQQTFSKIAVLNTVSENLGFTYYGIALCGIPKLVRVDREEISICNVQPDPSIIPAALTLRAPGTKVTLDGEEAWVPDLDYIEQQITRLFR
jgi:chemosensory pili system protein ChpC